MIVIYEFNNHFRAKTKEKEVNSLWNNFHDCILFIDDCMNVERMLLEEAYPRVSRFIESEGASVNTNEVFDGGFPPIIQFKTIEEYVIGSGYVEFHESWDACQDLERIIYKIGESLSANKSDVLWDEHAEDEEYLFWENLLVAKQKAEKYDSKVTELEKRIEDLKGHLKYARDIKYKEFIESIHRDYESTQVKDITNKLSYILDNAFTKGKEE